MRPFKVKTSENYGSETVDLGIKGRRAIVCASSKGLGRACAIALANEGVHVTLTARGAEALKATADEIRKKNPGITVTEIAGDITTPAGREAVLKACPDPDILINNAGGPPPGDFRNWTRDDWIKAIDANMLTPIELIKATVDGMMARKFGRIVNITSAAVKSPIDILGLSNGARAGLTGFIAGISRMHADFVQWVQFGCSELSRPVGKRLDPSVPRGQRSRNFGGVGRYRRKLVMVRVRRQRVELAV